jgi:hypothetical protein
MKLHPPTVEIPTDNPYNHDLFDRKEFGDSLTSLFTTIDENIVLCIDAPWGEGKTTFARMWIADLLKRGVHCIYFDAYKHDYSDDPFVSFCTEIISLAETAFADSDAIQALKEDFKTKAKRIGGKLLCTGTRIGVKTLTLGLIKDSDLDTIDSIRSDVADSSSAAVSAFVGKAFDDYVSSKDSLSEFRDRLSALAAAVRAAQEFPLLIVVDELDRCRPDFALSLIERIKHLFSTRDLSFFLLVNTAQLQNYVKTVYGAEVDARNYLHKFFTISTDLPQNRQDSHDNDHSKYTRRLIQHYGLDSRQDLGTFLSRLFQYYGFSLREMERCFSTLALYFSQLPDNRLSISEAVAFLSILRLRFPDVFAGLSAGSLTYDGLLEVTRVDKIQSTDYTRFSKDWFLNMLKFLLLTKEEYEALDQNDSARDFENWLIRYHIDRMKVMPFLCLELTRFKIVDI